MAVNDEIVALRSQGGTPRDIAALKALRHAEALPSMARPYTRGGYRFTISDFAAEERHGLTMLRLLVTVRQAPNGPVVIAADDPLNPMFFVNPPVMVPDGEEDDPANPGQKRQKHREDLTEALRQMLDAKLAEKLRA